MPRIKLTKSAIDALPTPKADVVYWDAGLPGFGVKVTPKGRKVFIVLYRTGGAGSRLPHSGTVMPPSLMRLREWHPVTNALLRIAVKQHSLKYCHACGS
jgi:hypothetical protein